MQNYQKVHPSKLDDFNYGNELWENCGNVVMIFLNSKFMAE